MELSVTYLGLELPHPLVLGASPLVDDLDAVRRAEDGGAAAIVMHSLFEEQLGQEHEVTRALSSHDDSFAEALYFRPHRADFALGPHEYLDQLARIKSAVAVPVIASLNGITNRGWLEYARLMDQAGADAIELNVYRVASNPDASAEQIEKTTIDMLESVKNLAKIPVAMKLSPFYTSLASFVARLKTAGADGFVLFNRFYQPDIDVEELEVTHRLELSGSSELLLRLRWLAILSAQLDASFAVTGGVHGPLDALKAVMAGADTVQLVSEILKHGPKRFGEIRTELTRWLEEHGYDSLRQARGSMNLSRCPDPGVYERANYLRVLRSFHVGGAHA